MLEAHFRSHEVHVFRIDQFVPQRLSQELSLISFTSGFQFWWLRKSMTKSPWSLSAEKCPATAPKEAIFFALVHKARRAHKSE